MLWVLSSVIGDQLTTIVGVPGSRVQEFPELRSKGLMKEEHRDCSFTLLNIHSVFFATITSMWPMCDLRAGMRSKTRPKFDQILPGGRLSNHALNRGNSSRNPFRTSSPPRNVIRNPAFSNKLVNSSLVNPY